MERINHPTAVDIGGGRRGFRSKDTVAGVPGTVCTATHLNAMQEEIMAVVESAGLVPDGDNLGQLLAALGFRLKNTIIQPAPGTYTWTKQAWCRAVRVRHAGGSGGGAGAASSSGGSSFSGGGAGGGSLEKFFLAAALTPTVTYIVGAGGLGAAYAGSGLKTGGDGGTTSFGSYTSTTGGQGGYEMPFGTTPGATSGSSGGTATGGDISMPGENGDAGYRFAALIGRSGDGGSSRFSPRMPGFFKTQAGFDGRGPGGGGCGAASFDGNPSTGSYKGGDGKPGIMIIEEYL